MTEPDATHAGQHTLRDGHGVFMVNPDTVERDAQACRLRRDGKKLHEIAEIMGYATRSGPQRAIQRALLATVQEPADEVRALELERLDYMWVKAMEVLNANHLMVQMGKVVTLMTTDGERLPVKDYAPALSALGQMLKIQERRAKLLGLDAATKVHVFPMDEIDLEIQRLRESMEKAERDERSSVDS